MLPLLFVGRLYIPGPTYCTQPIQAFFIQVNVFLHHFPISPSLPLKPRPHSLQAELYCSSDMNIHLEAVFNTVLHHTRVTIPYITASVSYEPETVHLQQE